jgi:hypothetical protein
MDSDHDEENGLQESRDRLFGQRIPAESEGNDDSSDDEEEEEEEEPSEKPFQNQSHADDEPSEDVTSTLKKTREADIKKGQAVKRQIVCL